MYTEEELAPLFVYTAFMGLFSSKKTAESEDFSENLFDEVTVMGQGAIKPAPTPSPSPRIAAVPGKEQVAKTPVSSPKKPVPGKEAFFKKFFPKKTQSVPRDTFLPAREPGGFPFAQKNLFSNQNRLFLGIALLVLILGALGAFLFFRRTSEEAPSTTLPETPAEVSAPVLAVETFAMDKPNYLSINTETATVESFRAELEEQGKKIREAGIAEPIAFRVTDQNNNPLAFSRLAFLMDIKLPEDLLAALDEDFLLQVLDEQGESRMSLQLGFKENYANPESLVSAAEPALLGAFQELFYPAETTFPAKAEFQAGSYNGNPVRYINIDAARNYSLDYLLAGKLLIIGNSKEAVRKIAAKAL